MSGFSIDQFQQFQGYNIENVPYDGQCGFTALAKQLSAKDYVPAGLTPYALRQDTVKFVSHNVQLQTMAERVDRHIDEYLLDTTHPKTWIDEDMLYATSILYDVEIRIIRGDNLVPTIFGRSTLNRYVTLGYVSSAQAPQGDAPNHYISLHEKNQNAIPGNCGCLRKTLFV